MASMWGVALVLSVAACSGVGASSDGAAPARAGQTSAGPTSAHPPGAGQTSAGRGGTDEPSPSVTTAADRPTGWGPTVGELARARSLVSAMSLADQASTVLMPGFWGHDADRPTDAEAALNRRMHGSPTATEVLAAHPFGGVFLRPEVISDATQVAALDTALHATGDRPDGLPLLVSIDQEGGGVQRLVVGVARVPSAASVGVTGDPAYARQVAHDNGAALRALGVTMVMAPVADVDPDGRSVLGSRTYSRDRKLAATMVTATMRGYLSAGVLPVVKHFPGLGSVLGDSHHALPSQPKSLAELRRTDLVTFAAAVDAGAPVVMTAHLAVDAVRPGRPGSITAGVVQGLLRGVVGFQGVAVTDSQGMGPINGPYDSGRGAVLSLQAGNDLVLNSPYPVQARQAIIRAVTTGQLSAGRLMEAASRVIALRIYQQRLASRVR